MECFSQGFYNAQPPTILALLISQTIHRQFQDVLQVFQEHSRLLHNQQVMDAFL